MTTTHLVRGATVWSRKLQWSIASGDMIRQRYGVGGGQLAQPDTLTVAKAMRAHVCRDCGHVIPKGTLYGVTPGGTSRYCPACVVTVRPEDQFKTKAA